MWKTANFTLVFILMKWNVSLTTLFSLSHNVNNKYYTIIVLLGVYGAFYHKIEMSSTAIIFMLKDITEYKIDLVIDTTHFAFVVYFVLI